MSYEWGRLGRVAVAGVAGFLAADIFVPRWLPPLASLLLHGTVVVAVYPLVLLVTGFYKREEIALVSRMAARFRRRTPVATVEESTEMAGDVMASVPDETGRRAGAGG